VYVCAGGCELAQNESIVFVFRYVRTHAIARKQAEAHGEHQELLISRYDFLLGRCAKQSRGFGVNGTESKSLGEDDAKKSSGSREIVFRWLLPGLAARREGFSRARG
jgi:hypothetical protein